MITKFGIAVLAVLLLCSCRSGTAKQLAKAVSKELPDVVTEIPPVQRPRSAPIPTEADVERAAVAILEPHVDDATSDEQARSWVKTACAAKDMIEIGTAKTWAEAARKAVEATGGKPVMQAKIQSLGQDLQEAEDSRDFTLQVTAFVICESV